MNWVQRPNNLIKAEESASAFKGNYLMKGRKQILKIALKSLLDKHLA